MDVVKEIEVLENDVRDCKAKCQRVNCNAIYDAIMPSLKLFYDLIFMCCKKKDQSNVTIKSFSDVA